MADIPTKAPTTIPTTNSPPPTADQAPIYHYKINSNFRLEVYTVETFDKAAKSNFVSAVALTGVLRYPAICNFLPQTRDANGCCRHPSSPRKLPQRTRKVSECVGLVRGGGRAGSGHGVSLEARPPCGERGLRPRLTQRLFKYA